MRRLVALLVSLFVCLAFAGTTAVAAPSSRYDAPTVTSDDARELEAAEARSVVPSGVREWSAWPSTQARGTSMTPDARGVATNTVDPNTVRFSQDSASHTFRDGRSVSAMAADLKSGDLLPGNVQPIRLVERDGLMFTLDHRRLVAFQEAGVRVPFRMATQREITKGASKFTTKNNGTSIQLRLF